MVLVDINTNAGLHTTPGYKKSLKIV